MGSSASAPGDPIVIGVPDAAGVVTLQNWKTSAAYIAVDGVRLRRSFTSKSTVPTVSGGAVELSIRGGMPGYVRVLLGSKILVDTGRPPAWMWILVLLPSFLLLLLQGLLGFGIAFGLVFAIRTIVTRDTMAPSIRILMSLGLLFAGLAVELTVISALMAARV